MATYSCLCVANCVLLWLLYIHKRWKGYHKYVCVIYIITCQWVLWLWITALRLLETQLLSAVLKLVIHRLSAITGSASSLRCQLQYACVAFTISSSPCPKLDSRRTDHTGWGSNHLQDNPEISFACADYDSSQCVKSRKFHNSWSNSYCCRSLTFMICL